MDRLEGNVPGLAYAPRIIFSWAPLDWTLPAPNVTEGRTRVGKVGGVLQPG